MTIPLEATIYLYNEIGGDKPPPLLLLSLVSKDDHTALDRWLALGRELCDNVASNAWRNNDE